MNEGTYTKSPLWQKAEEIETARSHSVPKRCKHYNSRYVGSVECQNCKFSRVDNNTNNSVKFYCVADSWAVHFGESYKKVFLTNEEWIAEAKKIK